MKFLDYADNCIDYTDKCPGCAFAHHEFTLPCGMIYEDDLCTVAQDWQLPILGMIIVAPKRHVEKFEEMTKEERIHLFEKTNEVISILRSKNIVENCNVLFEEYKNNHFHIWILPRDGWADKNIDPIRDIRKIIDYASKNFKNNEQYQKIYETNQLLKKEMNQ